jgi:hypothetical protein
MQPLPKLCGGAPSAAAAFPPTSSASGFPHAISSARSSPKRCAKGLRITAAAATLTSGGPADRPCSARISSTATNVLRSSYGWLI